MSNPLKKIGKAVKSVGKAVKKVFKSDVFKAVAIGAAAFFALPVAATALGVGAGAAGGAAAGAGAGAWWSSTLGIGAAGAGTAAGTAATTAANAAGTAALGSTGAAAAGSAFPASIAGMAPMASTVAAPQAVGLMGAAPAMTGSLGQAAGAAAGGFSAAAAGGSSAGTSGAFGGGAEQVIGGTVKSAGEETARQGLLGRAAEGWKGLDPMTKFGLMNTAGQGLSGWASAKQAGEEAERRAQLELEMQERMWAREDELQNRKSVFGKRYDGSGGYDYNIGNLMYQSGGNQSFGNFIGSSPGQKKKEEEIFANYNPYWS